jgi:ankyrin repeat protein
MRRHNFIVHIAAAIAVLLLAANAYASDKPVVASAKLGDAAEINRLIAAGLDANEADDDNLTALNWAAYSCHLDAMRALVQHGAKIDAHASKTGWTPLMNASAMCSAEIAAYLIAHGANLNAHSADGGYTPLMYAAEKNHLDVAALLLKKGADINDICDDKRTALDFADNHPETGISALLKAQGAVSGGN